MLGKLRWFLLLFLTLPPTLSASPPTPADLFPSAGFEDRVHFWKEVFTRYGEREVVFHDEDDLGLVYDVMEFEKGVGNDSAEYRRQRRRLKEREKQLQRVFSEIRRFGVNSDRLGQEHRKVLEVVESQGHTVSSKTLQRLANNIRSQRGIKEKFREGLVRSGRYMAEIREIFSESGLPLALGYLPHVESSFDYSAYSKRGAAGIWQFMRGTGRQYLKINRYVDERLDPVRASEAAALLLKENYKRLGNSPLAITAFNHGQNGMRRAQKQFGPDLLNIIQHYRSRLFGFASKNFYAEFLAAVEVAENYQQYFGPIQFDSPMRYETVLIGKRHHLSDVTQVATVSSELVRAYNPQLRSLAAGSSTLPAGIHLRLPVGQGELVAKVLEATPAASGEIVTAADGSVRYRVERGDTLSDISGQFGVAIGALKRNNNIRNANRIYPGRLLLIEGPSNRPALASADSQRPSEYQVRRGDTLARIARKFGISQTTLQRLNKISDPHRIYLGQVLLLP